MASPRPSSRALSAFGADASSLEGLSGGRGLTWRAGDLVLRPSPGDAETVWKAEVLAGLTHSPEFCTPRPIPAHGGGWAVDGWEGWEWLPGASDESRVEDVLRAGAGFHRAVAHLARPTFLDDADDPWARSDRIAWEEERMPEDGTLRRLAAAFASVETRAQIIHGDLLGNVMFAEGRPPAIIDWAPYWRPTGYADAIVLADAACWHGLSIPRMLALAVGVPEGRQMLVRALVFRIATLVLNGVWDEDMRARHGPVVDAALS